MKLLSVFLAAVVLVAVALPLRAVELGEVPSVLPGLKLVVTEIRRVDADHVVVVVRAKADDAAPSTVKLEEPPLAKPPANANPADLEDPKYQPQAYSLLPSTLVDEATGRKFSAIPLPPNMPFLGPSLLGGTLDPGSWIQMAVCFKAPHPLPPGPTGVVPDQKVTFQFAKAAKPLSGLVLPPTPAN